MMALGESLKTKKSRTKQIRRWRKKENRKINHATVDTNRKPFFLVLFLKDFDLFGCWLVVDKGLMLPIPLKSSFKFPAHSALHPPPGP